MIKKKKPLTNTIQIPRDMYVALILCHQELELAYNHFGNRDNAYSNSPALKLAQRFEDTLDKDANMVADSSIEALSKKSNENAKCGGKNKARVTGIQRLNQINKAIDLFFAANKDGMNGCFSRFSYLKLKEVTERVLEAVDETGNMDREAVTDDDFMKACGDELSFHEVIMHMEEDMNIQMPDDFTDMICKIKKLTIEEFAIIIYKAGQRSC